MENKDIRLISKLIEAAKKYASETHGSITVSNPTKYKAFRDGQESALKIMKETPQPTEQQQSEGVESIKLLTALLSGTPLQEKGNSAFQSNTFCCEYLDGHPHLYADGWGSVLGTMQDRIMSIIKNPEKWEVKPTPTHPTKD